MRSWRGHVGRGKATAAAHTAAHMGCGKAAAAHTAAAHMKAAASTTAAAKMVLRVRAGRNTGRSKKNKGERNRTHGRNLHVALFLNA
jgi:hypothetical protein